MPYAIDKQKTFDLVGGSAEDQFDVGSHDASRTVHVVEDDDARPRAVADDDVVCRRP